MLKLVLRNSRTYVLFDLSLLFSSMVSQSSEQAIKCHYLSSHVSIVS